MGAIAREGGFTLLELLIATGILLVVVVTSLLAISRSSDMLQKNEQLVGASNAQRVAQNYLRSMNFGLLKRTTASSLTAAISRQLETSDWRLMGSTASVTVYGLATSSTLVTADLRINFGSGRVATTSIRIARRGVNP